MLASWYTSCSVQVRSDHSLLLPCFSSSTLRVSCRWTCKRKQTDIKHIKFTDCSYDKLQFFTLNFKLIYQRFLSIRMFYPNLWTTKLEQKRVLCILIRTRVPLSRLVDKLNFFYRNFYLFLYFPKYNYKYKEVFDCFYSS